MPGKWLHKAVIQVKFTQDFIEVKILILGRKNVLCTSVPMTKYKVFFCT